MSKSKIQMINKIQNPNIKIDEKYMRIAIGLAKRAEGMTSPNPIVGAVVVKDGRIVGKGYHRAAGLSHAEVDALLEARDRARGATLYVTLEPCDHFGRTPPCTDLIIRTGIRRVVAGMPDPNPINNGRGMKRLAKHGIKTVVGLLADDVRSINKVYTKYITKNLPYVTIKVAQSLDGKIATRSGDSRWITAGDSRCFVHRLRSKVDAVMVGVNTVIMDNPLLTARFTGSKEPVRVIVDSGLRTPITAKIFSNIKRSPVIIATVSKSEKSKIYEAKGAVVLRLKKKNGRVDIKELLKTLAKRQITHVLVEGGGELNAGLLEARLVDKLLFFVAPKIVGGREAITSVEGNGVSGIGEAINFKIVSVKRFENDILLECDPDWK